MTTEIKELESTLAASRLQTYLGRQSPDGLACGDMFVYSQRRFKADNDSSGTLGIDQDGVAKYFGETSDSDVSKLDQVHSTMVLIAESTVGL